MPQYILDTNIFNRALDGQFDLGVLKSGVELFATHIELNELENTKNPERRAALLEVFRIAGPEQIPTESAVWGISEWGAAKWTSDDNLYQPIVNALNEKNGGKPNNAHDALIAETAIRNRLILVTEDGDLSEIASMYGAEVLGIEAFHRQTAA